MTMIFHLLATAPLALCPCMAKASAVNPWPWALGVWGWRCCQRSVCSSRLAVRAGGEPAAPKVSEDRHTEAGSVGRLKTKVWNFWVGFALCYQVSPCKGEACCSHPKGDPGKRSCLQVTIVLSDAKIRMREMVILPLCRAWVMHVKSSKVVQ